MKLVAAPSGSRMKLVPHYNFTSPKCDRVSARARACSLDLFEIDNLGVVCGVCARGRFFVLRSLNSLIMARLIELEESQDQPFYFCDVGFFLTWSLCVEIWGSLNIMNDFLMSFLLISSNIGIEMY